jgi:hypothetical protein
MRLLSICLTLLLGSTASAAETDEGNLFHADVSSPDLALAVTSFETVCMPFILHKTEMTRDMDKAHSAKRLTSQNYEFQSSEIIKRRYLVEPAREEWKPSIQAIDASQLRAGGRIAPHTRGKFTVFTGKVKNLPQTTVTQTGEIMGPNAFTPAIYKTRPTEDEIYILQSDNRLTAKLGWNYPSQNHPAKSCEIRLGKAGFESAEFVESFIEKDKDWKRVKPWEAKNNGWSQCVSDGDDQFLFTVKHHAETLNISVKRNDFYEPKICK